MPESRLPKSEITFLRIAYLKIKIAIFTLILICLAQSAFAQAPPNSTTRSAYQANAVGSYQLSGFDNINYFNGNLSVNLPLATVGGRGEASFSPTLSLGNTGWHVEVLREQQGSCNPPYIQCNYQNIFTPVFGNGNALKAGLGPGGMRVIQTGRYDTVDCSAGLPPHFSETLTTITFVMPGDVTVELRDEAYDGKPLSVGSCHTGDGPSRGTVFKAHDGSGITFVSDTAILDYLAASDNLTPSGNVYFKNGVRYRIDNGGVSRITDRNGNWINFTYNASGYIATDSLGRETTVTEQSYPNVTTITTKRQNNETRTTRIRYYDTDNECQPLNFGQAFSFFNGATREPGASYTLTCHSTKIELPDGRYYRVKFNPYGEVSRIELPTGGATEYDWGSGDVTPHGEVTISGNQYNARGFVYRRVTERRMYDNGASGANYTSKITISGGTVKEYAAGSPDPISRTDHFFYGDPMSSFFSSAPYYNEDWRSGKEYQTDVYSGDGGQLLRRVHNTYQQRAPVGWYYQWCSSCPANFEPMNDPRLVETVTTLADSNQVSKTTSINPATQAVGFDQYNNQTDVFEYDFGSGAPGALKRHMHTDFMTDPSYVNLYAYLRSLPLHTWVAGPTAPRQSSQPIDPDPTPRPTPQQLQEYIYSRTDYEYDNYANSGNNALLTDRLNVIGHDANYNRDYSTRGNVTKVTSYGDAINQTEAVSSYANYDILGNVVKTIDGKGYVSTISYNDDFGSPDNEARTNTAPGQLNGQSTFAFPTSGTNAMNWIVGYTQYDYFTGQAVNSEDINGVISKTVYNDWLDRPTQTVTAIGTDFERQTTINYHDDLHQVEQVADLNALNDNLIKSESFYDGLGRTVKSRKYEAAGGYIETQSVPFVMVQDPETSIRRVGAKQTNPYRPAEVDAAHPIVWTTALSDALGRNIKTITPDGAIVKTDYSGSTTTVTDQAGKQRRSVTNALGQLTRVDEPNDGGQLDVNGTAAQPTSYLYDTLGNLTTVTQASGTAAQCGGAANCSQTRSFVYDSLSRLKQAINPESGTISYIYDSNGNLTNKTDARGVQTSYIYDALNRVTNRNYLAPAGLPNYGATRNVAYTYDNLPYAKGKLTKVSSADSTTEYTSFDSLGRVLAHRQATDGNVYQTGYNYNLSGALIEETYPSGRVVKNTLDADGDLAQVQSKKNQNAGYQNYAGAFTYTAAGAVSSMRLGNGRWESTIFNSRLQPTQIALGNVQNAANLLKLNYDYGSNDNNGNVKSQQITVPTVGANAGFTAIQNYNYDSLNRLKDASETVSNSQTWKQTFQYDRFGNRTFNTSNNNTTTLAANCPTNVCNPSANTANNRLTGASYDFSGNTTTDAENRTFVYNGENKQTAVLNSSGQSVGQYIYDGDGKRVKKISALEVTIFVYDAGGKMVAEYSTATNPTPQTNYLTSDNLGTPRISTDQTGAVISRHDYQPFGEEAVTAQRVSRSDYQGDAVRKQFTGYQKDEETDLDFAQARYYDKNLGRFNSADNFLNDTKVSDTQSWNLYIYVRNNPLTLNDPSGEKIYAGYITNRGFPPKPTKSINKEGVRKSV